MKDEKKAPKLRFKGFTDDWEQCKLKNKAEIVRGASPRPISNPKWFDDNSNVGWLRISDVTEQKGRIHHLSQRISKAGQSKTRVITEPHLLLSIAATVGSPVINYVNTGVHDGFLIFLNPTFDKEFMFQWLLMFKPYWNKYGQPGSQVNLNSDIVGNQSVAFPTTSEQERIGSFFRKLDRTITLHEEKKRQLERLKSALLQKMFADKSGYPDIRFEGFSDEWEQCKLGDVCEPITDSIDTQKYPNEVFAEYSMPAFDASMKPDIVLGSSMNSVRKIITRPCLLVNKLNVRKKRIWYVKKPNKNAVCSAEFIPLRSDTVDLTFLNQVAKSETFTRYLENHSSGSSNSQKRITPRSLMLSKLHIPTIEEQKLIGKIFEYLDHTITLHDQKLNLLKLVKQSLLQNMFI
ncbi:restriction endonuclease subunit S [Lactobacillus delbrueckii subsp. bulgaricus]|nr:hypothetical protein [Lactobacillus delbrueckii subsp. bulgaricus]